jgi:hypothetical protein
MEKIKKLKRLKPLELKEIQEKLRSGEMKVKIAPQNKLLKYKNIAEKFFTDILGYDIHKCLVTDWSSLTDWPEDLKVYRKKIKEKYGMTLPAGKGKHLILVNILEKIDKRFYQAEENRIMISVTEPNKTAKK